MGDRLRDCPQWLYLLRDFDAVYRYGSAGGSKSIRAHRRKVRAGISTVFESNAPVIAREPAELPVTLHLPRALDVGARGALDTLTQALRPLVTRMTWEYGYERVPRGLQSKYGYCELVGPNGPVVTDQLILGLVLFAPRTIYPQHHHRGIEESYVSLAGAWSENDDAVYAPGSMIFNRSDHEHRITTGDYEPCLLAYAWTGAPERLRHPGMSFESRRASPSRP